MNADPLAEISRRWSPYNYCYNNPVYFVGPDGMSSNPGEGMAAKRNSGLEDDPIKASADTQEAAFRQRANNMGGHSVNRNIIRELWNKSGSGITVWVNNGGSFSKLNENDEYEPTTLERLSRFLNYSNPVGVHINLLNSTMSLITGKKRHVYGPDAIIFTKGVEGGALVGGTTAVGFIAVLRGKQVGLYALGDYGYGLSTVSISTGFAAQAVYYSGSIETIETKTFAGDRTTISISGDAIGSLGVNVTYASLGNEFYAYGVGISTGLGASMTLLDVNFNNGKTVIKE